MGFFTATEVAAEHVVTADSIPLCGACRLLESCNSPKMPPTGQGRKGILIIAEAGGEREDKEGVQLIGPSGQILRNALKENGIDLDRDCWKTNALSCRATNLATGKNRRPTDAEIGFCRPLVLKAVRDFNPHTIITLGGAANKSLLGQLGVEDPGVVEMWAGWNIPCQHHNAWICPTHHPAHLIWEKSEALDLWFRRHLKAAVQHKERPWKQVPNWKDEIEVIYDDRKAAGVIYKMMERGGLCSFDYETNMLKPDGPLAEIVCCSVCWQGKKTIAFPWHGKAIEAMRDFLRSHVRKIGANCKFEERWSMAKLGTRVRNWVWDCVIAAHVLDNRRGITSVKFQSFVRLGLPPYNRVIQPYLEAPDSRSLNRIREADPEMLLRYCGLDSFVEHRLALIQAQDLGVKL